MQEVVFAITILISLLYISQQGQGVCNCLNIKIRGNQVNYAVTILWFCYNYLYT
jgi:hypothetical protein